MFKLRIVALMALIALLCTLTSVDVISQEKKEGKVKGQLPAKWGMLDLSATQKEEIYKIQGGYKEKISKLEAEIASLKKEEQKKMTDVLTADQKKKLADILGISEKKDPKEKTEKK